MPVQASVNISVAASKSGAPTVGDANWSGVLNGALNFTDGTTAGKIDIVYVAERTVASNTTDSIDLAGALIDPLGTTITAAKLVGIVIINKPEDSTGGVNTTNLTLGSASATNFVPGFNVAQAVIRPGGMYALVNSDLTPIATITAATADILPIVNSTGAAATYQIALLLRSV